MFLNLITDVDFEDDEYDYDYNLSDSNDFEVNVTKQATTDKSSEENILTKIDDKSEDQHFERDQAVGASDDSDEIARLIADEINQSIQNYLSQFITLVNNTLALEDNKNIDTIAADDSSEEKQLGTKHTFLLFTYKKPVEEDTVEDEIKEDDIFEDVTKNATYSVNIMEELQKVSLMYKITIILSLFLLLGCAIIIIQARKIFF